MDTKHETTLGEIAHTKRHMCMATFNLQSKNINAGRLRTKRQKVSIYGDLVPNSSDNSVYTIELKHITKLQKKEFGEPNINALDKPNVVHAFIPYTIHFTQNDQKCVRTSIQLSTLTTNTKRLCR